MGINAIHINYKHEFTRTCGRPRVFVYVLGRLCACENLCTALKAT